MLGLHIFTPNVFVASRNEDWFHIEEPLGGTAS